MSASPSPRSRSAITKRLRAAGCVFAEDEARLLISEARTPAELGVMVDRRVAGLPLEHILGWAEFCGLRISVDPGVFVPRRRTEFLAQEAITLARQSARPVVVDLCCGSGAVGAAIVATLDAVELYAADIDPAAVRCARRNIAGGGQVFEGDLYAALPATLGGRLDILVANVPYVPTEAIGMMPREARLYEARAALDGGADGLDVVRRVAGSASLWLAPGGHLLVETSKLQAPQTDEIFARSGLIPRVASSDELDATVVIGSRPAPQGGRRSRPASGLAATVTNRSQVLRTAITRRKRTTTSKPLRPSSKSLRPTSTPIAATPTKQRALRPNLEISTPKPMVRARLIRRPWTAGRTTSPRLTAATAISDVAVPRSLMGARTKSATSRTAKKSVSVTRARLLMSE
jgi:release factor glutamine methyltransferase